MSPVFGELAIGQLTGSTSGRPLDVAGWTESTHLTAMRSRRSIFIRCCPTHASDYVATSRGKQILVDYYTEVTDPGGRSALAGCNSTKVFWLIWTYTRVGFPLSSRFRKASGKPTGLVIRNWLV